MMIFHAVLRGTGYAEIVPGRRGAVDQLLPLHPDRVRVERLPDMSLRFRVTNPHTGAQKVLLQEEVFYLTVELERMAGASELDPADAISEVAVVDEPGDSRSSRREEYRRRNSVEGQIERLIEAGFLPSQASMIVRRESELQMESLRARYEAERNGDPVDYWRSRNASSDALRQQLGDADYERYLTANNRSTSITISSVIDSSPAQSAGLQPGDEIVRYDGERVFSMTDLTRQTMDGIAGQNVVVDIMRGGTSMQIVIPRGPVGITGGRRRR